MTRIKTVTEYINSVFMTIPSEAVKIITAEGNADNENISRIMTR